MRREKGEGGEKRTHYGIMRTGHEGWPVGATAAQTEDDKSYLWVIVREVGIIA